MARPRRTPDLALPLTLIASAAVIAACRTSPDRGEPPPANDPIARSAHSPSSARSGTEAESSAAPSATQLADARLSEVSGLASSARFPDVLWAVNDGGHPAALFALSTDGQTLGRWLVDVENRDWEALTRAELNGEPYLLIGDIGDNRRRYQHYRIHAVREPDSLPTTVHPAFDPVATLTPDYTWQFRYADGPQDAEAMIVADGELLIVSKRRPDADGSRPGRIYRLPLGAPLSGGSPGSDVARQAGEIARSPIGFLNRLAMRVAAIDLDQLTDLAIDPTGGRLWGLTYQHVLRFDRPSGESWLSTLTGMAHRVEAHALPQAEALTVDATGLVWFTSEGAGAPLVPYRPAPERQ